VRVTVIAAGFDSGAPTRRRDERALGQVSGRQVPSAAGRGSSPSFAPSPAPASNGAVPAPAPVNGGERTSEPVRAEQPAATQPAMQQPVQQPVPQQAPQPVQQQVPRVVDLEPQRVRPGAPTVFHEDDDLDVPDFLK
jgi:cell division protein FtsZ